MAYEDDHNFVDTGDTEGSMYYQSYNGYGIVEYSGAMAGDSPVVMLTFTNELQFTQDIVIDGDYPGDVDILTLPEGFRPTKNMVMLPLYGDSQRDFHLYHVDIIIEAATGRVYKHDDSVELHAGDILHLSGMSLNLAYNWYNSTLPEAPADEGQ